jgi:hypothetical protein
MKPRGISLDGTLAPPKLVGVMVLLDRSGSMSSVKGPMEKAFNDFVKEQKELEIDGMWVTLHQFDSEGYEEVYNRRDLAQVGPLDLRPRSGTPLIDSLCRFVTDARKIVDDPNDPTERLLVVVVSDGQDTGGNTHTWVQAKELVDGIQTENCEMVWFGTDASILQAHAHIPAMAQAGASMGWSANAAGAAYMGKGLGATVGAMRVGMRAARASQTYTESGGAYDIKADATFKEELSKLKKQKADAKGSK